MAGTSTSKKANKKAATDKGSRVESESAIKSMRAEFQNADSAEKPKKSFKMLILVAVALIVVGGGAGGAWMFLLQPPEDAAEVVEPPPVVYPKIYVPTAAVHVPFVQRDGTPRRLIVYMTLEVEDREHNVASVKEAMPRLQEAFWRTLNAEPLPGAEDGAIELSAVKERIRAASEHVLGAALISEVLIRDARVVRGG